MKRLLILLFLSLFVSQTLMAANDRSFYRPKKKKDVKGYQRTALLIGNSNYDSSPLKNPVNDAKDMAKKLVGLGFEVTVVTDADQKTMQRAIAEFGKKIKRRRGVALFFYAGHGMQVSGENYLIPVKSDINSAEDVAYNAVPAGIAMAKMKSAGNPFNIIILDACRNNPYSSGSRSGTKGLATIDAPVGSVVIYATSPGRTASDGDGRNGLFTGHMLKHVGEKNIDFEMMIRKVRAKVVRDTDGDQVPWTSSSLQSSFYMAGDEHGPAPKAELDPEVELWVLVKESTSPKEVKQYIKQYPKGRYIAAAKMRLAQFEAGTVNKGASRYDWESTPEEVIDDMSNW